MTQSNQLQKLQDMISLEGQVAVVTGGAKGIGHGIVMRLAEAGAAVFIADRTLEETKDEREAIVKAGGKVGVLEIDIAQPDCGERIMEAALREFGRVDILVNNAGIYPMKPALQMTVEEWDRVQNVNLRAAFLISKAFGNHAAQRGGGGAIVNIGSIDSLHPSAVGLAAYDASKGGMLMFTKNFALEMAPLGVRVNLIAPGGITTEGTSAGMTSEQQQAVMKQFMALIPLGRMGIPDEIATVALALATPLTAYMTGSVVVVDGGRLLR